MQNSLSYLKVKVNEFIEDYQRQLTEREYQKQKIKQNVMLEIMSNRNRSQNSQSDTYKGSRVDSSSSGGNLKGSIVSPVSEKRKAPEMSKNESSEFVRSNSVPNAFVDLENENINGLQCAEITFKAQNMRNKGIELENESQNDNSFKSGENEDYEERDNKSQRGKDSEVAAGEKIRRSQLREEKINVSSMYNKTNKFERSQRLEVKKPYIEPESENKEEANEGEDDHDVEDGEPKGTIFVTMEENESMLEVEEGKNKNYAFDILMEKSDVVDDIDELRKRKIDEMERKRTLRIEEFRKNEEAKDIKRSNSIIRSTQKSNYAHNGSKISDDPDRETSKSKSQTKSGLNAKNSKEIIVQESAYHLKPPQPQRKSQVYNDREKADISREEPIYQQQTPKTVQSEYRGSDRSKGKSNIFRESPKRLDKSASKYLQDPKIEPKERKNTFVKQSNKKLMITALNNVCLPGELNRKEREKLSEVIDKESSEFFVFLFKEYSRKVIKAIYILDSTQTLLHKIYGEKAPQEIGSDNVQSFYRFDSGSREFKKLDGCKSFSLVVHAIDLA